MRDNEKPAFVTLLKDVMSYYKSDVSTFALGIFWEACKPYDFEQISKALHAHAANPDIGQFAPKVADLMRVLQGTTTDRAKMAWGKAYEAMARVGAYNDVCFDDGLIHLVVEDMGGWVKLCRMELKDLSYAQHQFCEAYRAYAGRGHVAYPKYLSGANGTGQNHAMLLNRGITPPAPYLIGSQEICQSVMFDGTNEARGALSLAAKPIYAAIENPVIDGAKAGDA